VSCCTDYTICNNRQRRSRYVIPMHSPNTALVQANDEKAAVEGQFKILYREKYVPLKQSHAAMLETEARLRTQRREAFEMVEKLRTELATAELKVRKSNLDVAAAEKTAQQMQKHIKVGVCPVCLVHCDLSARRG
jgi:hypothetical protein